MSVGVELPGGNRLYYNTLEDGDASGNLFLLKPVRYYGGENSALIY